MKDKEAIYDEQIFPLMKKIIAICKREQIPVFAEFQYNDTDFSKTLIAPNVEGQHFVLTCYDILSQCKEENGVNVDKFYLSLCRNFQNNSSMVMYLLGKPPETWKDEVRKLGENNNQLKPSSDAERD